ncbi:MAG: phosphatidylserine decarboxylase family protein [Planctomycetota bacterium]
MSANPDLKPPSVPGDNAIHDPRAEEPLPAEMTSIQPGGGFCMACELAWGRVRRWYLRTFCKAYLEQMRQCRRGRRGEYPHEILDPRDLKFHRNLGDFYWEDADDAFRWRDNLPVARVGLAEIIILGTGLLIGAAVLSWLFWPLAVIPLALALFVVLFFRDPQRKIPQERGVVVAPADGRVFSIREVEHDEFVSGPAVVIDIFLSVFNVHINRVPMPCRVLGVTYRPGKFLNALRAEAARENEWLEVRVESTVAPYRAVRIRQIAGAIARRVVCWTRPGDHLPRGDQFGMIKLGSRTELTIPKEAGLDVHVSKGDKVRAGSTIMARYTRDSPAPG